MTVQEFLEAQEALADALDELSERNRAAVNFIHAAYGYAEARGLSGCEPAPITRRKNMTGNQTVNALVLEMVARLEGLLEADPEADFEEFLRSLSDLAAVPYI